MCGKNQRYIIGAADDLGSPPRVREKLGHNVFERFLERITPACAGKTLRRFVASPRGRDHPRVCGKNRRLEMAAVDLPGSPPRVREKPEYKPSKDGSSRITPACAGKTHPWLLLSFSVQDHPRVCGKNLRSSFYA